MCVWTLSAWRSRILLTLRSNHAESQFPGCISANTAIEFPLGNMGDVVFGFLFNYWTLQMKLFKWLIFIFIQKFSFNNSCFSRIPRGHSCVRLENSVGFLGWFPQDLTCCCWTTFPPQGNSGGCLHCFVINPFSLAQHLSSSRSVLVLSVLPVFPLCLGVVWFHSTLRGQISSNIKACFKSFLHSLKLGLQDFEIVSNTTKSVLDFIKTFFSSRKQWFANYCYLNAHF